MVEPEFAKLSARWRSQFQVKGEVQFPSLPSCTAESLALVEQLLAQLGQSVTPNEQTQLQTSITQLITESFAAGPYARLTLSFRSHELPETGVTCDLATTIDRVPLPQLGQEPDAQVLALAAQWRTEQRLLAIGSGSGRNTLPLIEQGYDVATWEWRSLPENHTPQPTHPQNLLDPLARLEPMAYHFAFAPDLMGAIGQTPDQLRLLLAKLCDGVVSGGQIMLGLWLSEAGVSPRLQEWLQWQGYWVLTEGMLTQLEVNLPLKRSRCEAALAYEQERRDVLPEAYLAWLRGEHLYLEAGEREMLQFCWVVWERL